MINRTLLGSILPWLGKKKIILLKGARQVGKTTLLREIEKHINSTLKAKSVYLLADDLDNIDIFESNASLELYLKQFHNFPNQFIYLIIDEFQVIKNADLLLKNIFDKHNEKIQIIVSGSGSLEITHSTEYLTGRAIHFTLLRVSFIECFNYYNNVEITPYSIEEFDKATLFYNAYRTKLEGLLKEYISYGGYPEVVTAEQVEDKRAILISIIKSYIEKDVVHLLKVENISGFNKLIKLYSSQVGNLLNVSEISNTLGLAINTVKKYTDILIGTFIFNLVSPFHRNVRAELTKMPKIYTLDFGIKSYLLGNFSKKTYYDGPEFENFVYLTFLSSYDKDQINFYRTVSGSEIDFIIKDYEGNKNLIEVKNSSKVRLPLSIKNFEKKYPEYIKSKIVVTKDLIKKDKNIYFIPASVLPFVKI